MTGSKNKSKQRSKANKRALKLLADQIDIESYAGNDNSKLDLIELRAIQALESMRPYTEEVFEVAKASPRSVYTLALLWAVYLLAIVFEVRIITWSIDTVCDTIIKESLLVTTYWCINNIMIISDSTIRLAEEFKQQKINEIRDKVFAEEQANQADMQQTHREKIGRMVWEQKVMLHIIAKLDEHLQEVGRIGSGIHIARALAFVEKGSSVETMWKWVLKPAQIWQMLDASHARRIAQPTSASLSVLI